GHTLLPTDPSGTRGLGLPPIVSRNPEKPVTVLTPSDGGAPGLPFKIHSTGFPPRLRGGSASGGRDRRRSATARRCPASRGAGPPRRPGSRRSGRPAARAAAPPPRHGRGTA